MTPHGLTHLEAKNRGVHIRPTKRVPGKRPLYIDIVIYIVIYIYIFMCIYYLNLGKVWASLGSVMSKFSKENLARKPSFSGSFSLG